MTLTLKELARQWWNTDITMSEIIDVYQNLPMPVLTDNDAENGFDYINSTDPHKDNTLEAVRSLTDEIFDFNEEDFQSFCDEFLETSENHNLHDTNNFINNDKIQLVTSFFTHALNSDKKLQNDTIEKFETYPTNDIVIRGYANNGSVTMTDFQFMCLDGEFILLFDETGKEHFYGLLKEENNNEFHPVEIVEENLTSVLWDYLKWRQKTLQTAGF